MASIHRHVIHAFLRVLVFCATLCLVVPRLVLASFEATVEVAIALICATARSLDTVRVAVTRPSMQTAGYGHVAMLKGLGA